MNNAKIESSDVLTEILIRLPPKSLFRFISVSKEWRDLIKDPLFLATYSKLHSRDRPRLLAYIPRTFMISRRYRDKPMNILSIPGSPKLDKVPKRFGYFVTSSGGLILCRGPHMQYYVINPVTRRWVPLPCASTCSNDRYSKYVGFMCEENTTELGRPDYTVVRICDRQYKIKDNIMRIATYSSKSGKWVNSDLVATGAIGHLLMDQWPALPSVAGGVFHWCPNYNGVLMVYDPREKSHLQLIELPQSNNVVFDNFIITRSLSEDILMCSGTVDWDIVKLWRLEKGEYGSYRRATTIRHEEWVPMHQVVLAPQSIRGGESELNCDFPYLVGFISCDPIVVLIKVWEAYIVYNLGTESGEVVGYRGLSGHLCPFFESSLLSSYAL